MTLLAIFGKKELIHWSRMKILFNEMEDFGGKFIAYPILVILLSFFHYCFSGMHLLFELFLYLFNRKQFKQNLKSLTLKYSCGTY